MQSPLISIIVPIRNEAHYIARCLDSLLAQDYPHFEVWIVDGLSEDSTREQVHTYCNRDPRFQLIDNPERTAPHAMNKGLEHAQGDIIVRVDGHCTLAPDYLTQALHLLKNPEYGCVGGPLSSVGETPWAHAIAMAMSSPFGVGNARFRYSDQAGEVDTLAFGAYRREVFETVGRFNPELTRNQDDEYNYRVRAAGYKLYLSPLMRSRYYTRAHLRQVWRQYFQYGYWKVRVLQDHPGSLQLRHLVPGAFVFGLVSTTLASIPSRRARKAWILSAGLYGAAALVFARKRAGKDAWTLARVMSVFPVLHLAYGCGFWQGLWHALRKWRS